MYVALCVIVFFLCYGVTIVTTSIGYHRGLAHGAVRLHPVARRSLHAHLLKLAREGRAVESNESWIWRG